MANSKPCSNEKDKLEKYLEHIFGNYCKLSIDEPEIEFIRKGVETVTLEFLHKKYNSCEDTACKIKHFTEIEMVKAGSFYEGTRNGYPDEFDFIAVLGTVEEAPGKETESHMGRGMCMSCDPYRSDEFPDASIKFRFTYGSRAHGNAERLEFVYTNGKEARTIEVDIIIAIRCHNPEKFFYNKGISTEIYSEILNTGSFLFVDGRSSVSTDDGKTVGPWITSITETETRYVRDILSEKHRRVYRILKYLVNGYFGEDLFKHLENIEPFKRFPLSDASFCISSYAMKVAVIYHHFKCDEESTDVGDCVLSVLYYLSLAFDSRINGYVTMHSLFSKEDMNGSSIAVGNYEFVGNFYWCLKAFIVRLTSLKESDGLNKCEHDFENTFLEMALRLDIFDGYLPFLINLKQKYSNPGVLWPVKPKCDELVEKVEQHYERRNAVSDCPWCDYPIFILAHKRKL